MLFPILIALAASLCFAKVVSRVVASRISTKQKLYASEKRDAIAAAAAAWQRATREAEAAGAAPRCRKAEDMSDSSPDQSEAIVDMS